MAWRSEQAPCKGGGARIGIGGIEFARRPGRIRVFVEGLAQRAVTLANYRRLFALGLDRNGEGFKATQTGQISVSESGGLIKDTGSDDFIIII